MESEKRKYEILSKLNTIRKRGTMIERTQQKWIDQAIEYIEELSCQ